jgi:hypothetical protein
VLALASCTGRDSKIASIEVPRPDQTVGGNVSPRSYDIPAGQASAIRRLFKTGGAMGYPIAVVSAQGTQTQFVNPQPVFIGENRFVVGLPEQHHVALTQVIATMQSAPAPVAMESFEMTYWVVEATPADATTIAPDLEEVGKTLEGLGALGKRKFRLIDRVGGRVTSGDEATLRSLRTNVTQALTADASTLQLQLELEQTGGDGKQGPFMHTTLRLRPDQPIVLGDAALSPPVATIDGLVLYIVRARRVD